MCGLRALVRHSRHAPKMNPAGAAAVPRHGCLPAACARVLACTTATSLAFDCSSASCRRAQGRQQQATLCAAHPPWRQLGPANAPLLLPLGCCCTPHKRDTHLRLGCLLQALHNTSGEWDSSEDNAQCIWPRAEAEGRPASSAPGCSGSRPCNPVVHEFLCLMAPPPAACQASHPVVQQLTPQQQGSPACAAPAAQPPAAAPP